jgi:ubiquinone/menaquinone biosynthesis C-methylase UbiE
MKKDADVTTEWYEKSYNKQGFNAQRQYPNEELLRFLGRNYFLVPVQPRQSIKILEVGCGSCSNLWAIAKEGFDSYGIDSSSESIKLGHIMLKKWGVEAVLSVASMTELPFQDDCFDVICDVFSSYCLNDIQFHDYLKEINRTLKRGGRIFSYTPSTVSDAFTDFLPAEKIDNHTLNGIHRETSPYFGNFYPFRFTDPDMVRKLYAKHGINLTHCELLNRTYRNQKENFQFLIIEGIKE